MTDHGTDAEHDEVAGAERAMLGELASALDERAFMPVQLVHRPRRRHARRPAGDPAPPRLESRRDGRHRGGEDQQEQVVDRVREDVGPYLAERFEALREHPLVGDTQTCGLMGAMLLARAKGGVEGPALFDPALEVGMMCRAHCFANGLVMRATRDTMIIAPPLVMTLWPPLLMGLYAFSKRREEVERQEETGKEEHHG